MQIDKYTVPYFPIVQSKEWIIYYQKGTIYIDLKWYNGLEQEILKNAKVMSDKQLSKYYKQTISQIENFLYAKSELNHIQRIENLTKNEILIIYNYVLNKERKTFPKEFFTNIDYCKILISHLFDNVLKWNKNDILNNFQLWTLDKYSLYGIRKYRNLPDVVKIINETYNWDIKIWEYKNSSIYWSETLIKDAMNWFKNKIKTEKNINNIYDAYKFRLFDLAKEYNLGGLITSQFKNDCKSFYEKVFDETFNRQVYFSGKYDFEININFPSNQKYNNKLYLITEDYYRLDNIGKTLIIEIINYTENVGKFPRVNDLLPKNGYICNQYYKKYFKSFSNIYKYILPLRDMVSNCWNKKENRQRFIKWYCEIQCNESIKNYINNTNKLKQWIYKYFKRENIVKDMAWADDYVQGMYNLLIEGYPEIKTNKILFEWEWIAFYPKTKKQLIYALREFVLYRLNDIIVDLQNDIPTYLNRSFIQNIYSKFNTIINDKKFKNYYEWACLAFPEYANNWNEKDFGIIKAKDNTILDSQHEKDIYEFIKFELDIPIKYLGDRRSGKYTYDLPINDYNYKKTCPDFVIEYLNINNQKYYLLKPIIVEYYGFYHPNNKHHIFKEYVNKTNFKNKFYKKNNDVVLIDLYPNDYKNFNEIKNKINIVLENQLLKRTS